MPAAVAGRPQVTDPLRCVALFFHSGKYEGGIVDGNPAHIFTFSNRLLIGNRTYITMSGDSWMTTLVVASALRYHLES